MNLLENSKLRLVERVGYVYLEDQTGTKEPSEYQNRFNVVELIPIPRNNKICIRHRVGPEFIKGIGVNNDQEKQILIQAITNEGLVTQNCVEAILIQWSPF